MVERQPFKYCRTYVLIKSDSPFIFTGICTTTSTGLNIICQRDDTVYETAQSVLDEEYETIPLTRLTLFESWNYVLNQHIIS
jgi:hypothetical protein